MRVLLTNTRTRMTLTLTEPRARRRHESPNARLPAHAKRAEADQTWVGKEGRKRREAEAEKGRQLYARWMALPACLPACPTYWTVALTDCPLTERHSTKRGKAISGRKRRNASFPTMLAKEKMEENKKIHSAVAEERKREERRRGAKGV